MVIGLFAFVGLLAAKLTFVIGKTMARMVAFGLFNFTLNLMVTNPSCLSIAFS